MGINVGGKTNKDQSLYPNSCRIGSDECKPYLIIACMARRTRILSSFVPKNPTTLPTLMRAYVNGFVDTISSRTWILRTKVWARFGPHVNPTATVSRTFWVCFFRRSSRVPVVDFVIVFNRMDSPIFIVHIHVCAATWRNCGCICDSVDAKWRFNHFTFVSW